MTIAEMFNRIAPTYDLLNRLLSFRQDIRWRERAVSWVPSGRDLEVLDLATGTGDLAFTVLRRRSNVKSVVGIDVAQKMLEIAKLKSSDTRLNFNFGDACAIPFSDSHFDVVTMAFGIRNVSDPLTALREIKRVLKPGGRAIVLEFSTPQWWFKPLYAIYFRYVLPFIGGLLSGDLEAYRYLNRSAEAFVSGHGFLVLMKHSGFKKMCAQPLTLGIATIYVADA